MYTVRTYGRCAGRPAEQIDDDDVVPLPSHPARMVGGPVDMHAF